MRVIAGTYGSRKLQTLKGQALRPSSDRLRETLFNILGAEIHGAVFVDLFAGSGAVGIEALSRGAQEAIFVEHHAAGVKLLRRNLESLDVPPGGTYATMPVQHFPGAAEVLALDALAGLKSLVERRLRADLIFADPPYADTRAYEAVLHFLGDSDLLHADGRLILEHDRRRVLPAFAGQLERTRIVEQGDTHLSFYRPVRAA
jgi:16S rRNA (guanine(966)-N(2))-methyltransferase RsmD